MSELRGLPSVDEVLRSLEHSTRKWPRAVVVNEIRNVLAKRRQLVREGKSLNSDDLIQEVQATLKKLSSPSLRPVINATGIILHTNLGRAPLRDFRPICGWSNLEFDLESGHRGKRDVHTGPLLKRLLGREAIVVNNNAAAVFLVLHELATGGEVIVSRGELIEIGDGFRIPEIMQRSGAVLREVGTTNRTSIDDYRRAINDRTKLILRVHPSNFQISGFTARPQLEEICTLGEQSGLPVYEDLGSGCLVDLRSAGIEEPMVRASLESGVNLVSFSCDKLLGGPQSGIIAGDEALIARVRTNPMYRTFRIDKLVIEALESTLRLLLFENWNEIPAIAAIRASSEDIERRARSLAGMIPGASVQAGESPIGGGSTSEQLLPTWLVVLRVPKPDSFLHDLRTGELPIIARIAKGQIIFDMRTVSDSEIELVAAAVQSALAAESPHNVSVHDRR